MSLVAENTNSVEACSQNDAAHELTFLLIAITIWHVNVNTLRTPSKISFSPTETMKKTVGEACLRRGEINARFICDSNVQQKRCDWNKSRCFQPVGVTASQPASGWTGRAQGTKELRRQRLIQDRLSGSHLLHGGANLNL